jgi:hypothetical protein
MDATSLMLSLLFGSLGMGFLMYGKKAGRPVPACVGLGLMICPYFIPQAGVLIVVCVALSSVPYFLRNC